MVAALKMLFGAGREREALAFMEGDDQDTRASRRWGRGSVGFGRGWARLVSVGMAWSEQYLPMPLGSLGSETLEALGVCSPPTMVDVDDERLKVLASGARWVSLSSARCYVRRADEQMCPYALLVSFQLMAAAEAVR